MPDRDASPALYSRTRGEICVVAADTRASLVRRSREVRAYLDAVPAVALRDVAFTLNTRIEGLPHRLAIVAASVDDLGRKIDHALASLETPGTRRLKDRSGLYYFEEPLQGRLAFLFPGEGSQYPHMLSELCLAFPEARACFDRIDSVFADHARGYLPSDFVFPKSPSDAARMWEMDGAVEAVFTANAALCAVLGRLGIRPDVMVGHSTGDYSALLASGCLAVPDEETFIRFMLDLNALYGRLERDGAIPKAHLVAVGSPGTGTAGRFVQGASSIGIAMDNCPHQFVLAGSEEALRPVIEGLRGEGAVCDPLPFSRAYHTEGFRPVCVPLAGFYARLPIATPRVEVYSCATTAPLPPGPEAIRAIAVEQWARPVRFRETIEAMYAAGTRLFVEVGPRGNLTNFVDDILRGRPHVAVPSDVRHRPGLEQLHHMLALLAAQGVPMDLARLYDGRGPRVLSFEGHAEARHAAARRTASRMNLATGWPLMKLSAEAAASLRAHLAGPAPAAGASPIPDAAPAFAAGSATPARGWTSGIVPDSARAPVMIEPIPEASSISMGASPAGRLVDQHLRLMEQFLTVQEEVMRGFLAGRPPAPVDRPAPRPVAVFADPPVAPSAAARRAAVPAAPATTPVIAAASAEAPTAKSSAPQAIPAAAPAQPERTARMDRNRIAEVLLLLVSERTGYPADMLDPKLNLEADLGVDSIKKVEIFGTFQQQTGLLGPGDMEALGTRRSLQEAIDFIVARQEGGAAAAHPAVVALPATVALPAAAALPVSEPSAVPSAHPVGLPRMPFIETVLTLRPGEELVALRTLGLDEDLFLRDHALGREVSLSDPGLTGLPVVPLTMSMEMLAEAASVLAPGLRLIGMKDVRAHRWIVLQDDSLRLRLSARRLPQSDRHEVRVRIDDDAASPGADGAGPTPLVEGTMVFGAAYSEMPIATPLALRGERPSRFCPERLYREGMFHGPAFRGVLSMDRHGEDGAEATLRALPLDGLFRSHAGRSLVTDPVLLDLPGQVVGFWTAEHLERGYVVFPFHLEALDLFGPPPEPGTRLRCQARIALQGDRQVRSDLDVVTADGRVLARFTGWEDRRFDVPGPLFRSILAPASTEFSVPVALESATPAGARVCSRLDVAALPPELFEGHGRLWRRVLAHLVLSRRERAEFAALPLERQVDWLLLRVVAKEAARRHLHALSGAVLPPADVEIVECEDGRLRFDGGPATRGHSEPAVISVGAYGGSLFAAVGEARGGAAACAVLLERAAAAPSTAWPVSGP